MMLEIHILAWNMHTNVSPLDNWISNGNAKKKQKKLHRFASTEKNNTKMNDNINMDSTITGSMNDRS
jgi:hypothetical protein